MNRLIDSLSSARSLRLIVLDMCRINPFLKSMNSTYSSKPIGRGLVAPIETEVGGIIAFAAKDGQEALDGEGANSPFATALAKRLSMPNTDIRMVFDHVRNDVLKATGRKQWPLTYDSLPPEHFIFVR